MRASVSDIESFRRYRDDEAMPLEVLLAQLRRVEPPNAWMMAGTALHSILETAQPGDLCDEVESEGFRFSFELEADVVLPPVREMRGQRGWFIDCTPIEVRGRVDGLDGVCVTDHKLTKQWDAAKFADSYQWRLYLAMFGAKKFDYNVFVGRPDSKDETHVILKELHALTLWWYPDLERDVENLLREYVAFARVHLCEVAA